MRVAKTGFEKIQEERREMGPEFEPLRFPEIINTWGESNH